MIVISGCPRSGTSMMTHTIKEMLEDDGYKILGRRFPQDAREHEAKRFDVENKFPMESEEQFDLRKFMINTNIKRGKEQFIKKKAMADEKLAAMKEVKKLNIHGFWECKYTVQGCSYHPGIEQVLEGKKLCKIVSQGLPKTDPRYLTEGKIIFMVRNPREVAKSQEGLTHPPEVQKILDMDSDCKVHSPDMFINVSMQAARWFLNSGVDPLVIDYEAFCSNHEKYIDDIIKYLGMGNKERAMDVLDIEQKRSKSEDLDTEKFRKADEIYEKILNKDWQGVLDSDAAPSFQNTIQCIRMEQRIHEVHCAECQKCGDFTKSCIKVAEDNKIDWENLPCVYECGAGSNAEHIMVQESIDKNHWKRV